MAGKSNAMAQRVLIFGVAETYQVLSSRRIYLPARHTGMQLSPAGLDCLHTGPESLLHGPWRLGLGGAAEIPHTLQICPVTFISDTKVKVDQVAFTHNNICGRGMSSL